MIQNLGYSLFLFLNKPISSKSEENEIDHINDSKVQRLFGRCTSFLLPQSHFYS